MLNTIDKLNISYNGIFDNNKPMTQSEQMYYLLSKLNMIIEHFNILDSTTREKIKEVVETVDYYMSSGLAIETEKYLESMIKKGDFDKIINHKIFGDIQERLSNGENAINNLIIANGDISKEVINNFKIFSEFKKLQESINNSNDDNFIAVRNRIANIEGSLKIVTSVDELRQALLQGGKIAVKSGDYYISNGLEYVSNTELYADGKVTFINSGLNHDIMFKPKLNGSEGKYTGVKNVTIKNIEFSGNGAINKYGLFATAHGDNIKFLNCGFRYVNGSWHGVEINSSRNVTFENCTFEGYNVGCSAENNATEMVQLDYAGSSTQYPFTCNFDNTKCKDITFRDCSFIDIDTNITGAVGSHTYHEDYMPENVTFDNCSFLNIDICIWAKGWQNTVISKCKAKNVATFFAVDKISEKYPVSYTISDCYYDGYSRYKKIGHMNDTNEGRFIFELSPNIPTYLAKVSNCTIKSAFSHGIGCTMKNGNITGCSVEWCGKNGIYVYGADGVSVTGNICHSNGGMDTNSYGDIMVRKGQLDRINRLIVANNVSYVKTDGLHSSYSNAKIKNNLGADILP